MQASPTRFSSILEWLLAAAVMVAALAAGSLVVREFRGVRAATPVIAEEAMTPDPPLDVPSRAVSVPMLVFADGKEVRVGDSASAVAGRIGEAQVGVDAVEVGTSRQRVTRSYRYIGAQFALVFELDEGAEAKVAAIYLQ